MLVLRGRARVSGLVLIVRALQVGCGACSTQGQASAAYEGLAEDAAQGSPASVAKVVGAGATAQILGGEAAAGEGAPGCWASPLVELCHLAAGCRAAGGSPLDQEVSADARPQDQLPARL